MQHKNANLLHPLTSNFILTAFYAANKDERCKYIWEYRVDIMANTVRLRKPRRVLVPGFLFRGVCCYGVLLWCVAIVHSKVFVAIVCCYGVLLWLVAMVCCYSVLLWYVAIVIL